MADQDELGIWSPDPGDEPATRAAQPGYVPPPAAAQDPDWAQWWQAGQYAPPQQQQYGSPAYQSDPAAQATPPGYLRSPQPAATPQPAPTVPGGPRGDRGVARFVAVLLGVVVVAGAAAAALILLTRGGGSRSAGSAGSSGSPVAAHGSSGSTTDDASFTQALDSVLGQSATGRQAVISVVSGAVNGCSVAPQDGADQLDRVIANRRQVLDRLTAVPASTASQQSLKSQLTHVLSEAIQDDGYYQTWLAGLARTYPDASPAGCPDGQAPQDDLYAKANTLSDQLNRDKQAFAAAYDALASRYGLRTWSYDEF